MVREDWHSPPLTPGTKAAFFAACKDQGFAKRGNACFKVQGDGIFLVLKLEKQGFHPHNIRLGLFSLYDELSPQWFTSAGCIPRYDVVNLAWFRDIVYSVNTYRKTDPRAFAWARERGVPVEVPAYTPWVENWIITPEEQLELLIHLGFPWLNQVQTQAQLVEAIVELELKSRSTIYWNDMQKFAPYLMSGNYPMAAKVVQAILDQHGSARKVFNHYDGTPERYRELYGRMNDEDRALLDLLDMALKEDRERIAAYTTHNYTRNLQQAKFCLKKE